MILSNIFNCEKPQTFEERLKTFYDIKFIEKKEDIINKIGELIN